MKKLTYAILFFSLLTLFGCQSINNGLSVLSKCCGVLSIANKASKKGIQNKDLKDLKNTVILPVNSWDGKMMIW
jgi:hypothetical protein